MVVVQLLSCVDYLWTHDCSTPGFPVLHYLLSQQCHPTISSSVVPFSSCLQSFPASGSFPVSHSLYQVAKVLELQLQHQSFQWIFRTDVLSDWLIWSPCSPRDSQESSPTPQFKSINSSSNWDFMIIKHWREKNTPLCSSRHSWRNIT